MSEQESARVVLGRAGRRAVGRLIQAAIEGLRSVEVILEEIGHIGAEAGHHVEDQARQKIDIE